MNQRLLGGLCIIGGVAYLINGLRFFLAGVPVQGVLVAILTCLWALGGISGILGMQAAQVTGTNRVVQLLSYLPAAAFLATLAGTVQSAVNPLIQFSPLIVFGLLGLVVGMLLVGVFTLRANVWKGWKKVVPFLPAVMPFIGMAIGAAIGVVGGVNVSLVALSWILLGYCVVTSPAPFRATVLTA
jgi:hypothetical protein